MAPLAAVVALALMADPASGSAFEQALARAENAYNEAEFDEALKAIVEAEQSVASEPERLRALLFRGVVLANVPDADAASAAFTQALALDPEAKLPLLVSPKVALEYERLQKAAREKAALPTGDAPTKTSLSPSSAGGGEATPRAFAVPVVPTVSAGVAVAAVGTGVVFGLMSSGSVGNARNATWANEKAALRDQASTQATVANVAFAVAGTAAVTAVITWLVLER